MCIGQKGIHINFIKYRDEIGYLMRVDTFSPWDELKHSISISVGNLKACKSRLCASAPKLA